MAFIAPLAGAAVGGGLLGSIVTTAVGVGLNLAIAYFFPQKIKGPRAESLKAQTSRYGEQLTRWYGAVRTAGAVIWLKGDHVDEHVKTERQGKALGPEVTTYSYTATFAVAFAWNGPASGITRIWADDKLIFDVSAEALENAILHGGTGIGIAKGASIKLYLGTDTQEPDPDIEADRGAGQVPAWPGIVYAVIKNLPLDEFGIRVPNIEAEITKAQSLATSSVTPTITSDIPWQTDSFGNYFATAADTTLHIERLPGASVIAVNTLPHDAFCVHITELNKVAVTYSGAPGMRVFDAATGAMEQDISGVGPSNPVFNTSMDDISFGGVNYLFAFNGSSGTLNGLSNIGTGYSLMWSVTLPGLTTTRSLSASSSRLYAATDLVFSPSKKIIVIDWNSAGASASEVTLSALDTNARACFYDEESDSVIIETTNGSLYVYTPDLSTLLRSKTNSYFQGRTDPMLSKRMKIASDQIAIKVLSGSGITNDILIYRVSDLSLVQHIEASETTWDQAGSPTYVYAGFNQSWQMCFTVAELDNGSTRLWYLPRAQRQPVPLADVLAEECTLAGLPCDASKIATQIMEAA